MLKCDRDGINFLDGFGLGGKFLLEWQTKVLVGNCVLHFYQQGAKGGIVGKTKVLYSLLQHT